MCVGQPQLQRGQRPPVGAVRLAGTGSLLGLDALAAAAAAAPLLASVRLLVLRPALVLGQEDVEVFPPARHGPPVGQGVSL